MLLPENMEFSGRSEKTGCGVLRGGQEFDPLKKPWFLLPPCFCWLGCGGFSHLRPHSALFTARSTCKVVLPLFHVRISAGCQHPVSAPDLGFSTCSLVAWSVLIGMPFRRQCSTQATGRFWDEVASSGYVTRREGRITGALRSCCSVRANRTSLKCSRACLLTALWRCRQQCAEV